VLWRTRGSVGFFGFIQSGEIEVEYRINGVLVRSIRLSSGDPVPPRRLQGRATMIARALTDVRLRLVPEAQIQQQGLGQSDRVVQTGLEVKPISNIWLTWAWPILLLLLIIALTRTDLARIASGLLYIAANREQYYPALDPRSISLLKYAEQVDPQAAFAYNEEGYRWFEQDRLPDAKTAFGRAVDSNPENASALNNMAITDFRQGDLAQSAHYLQQAARQDPDNALIRYNLGIILMRQNDGVNAIREFREASFIDPKAVSPYLQQAFLYLQMGDYANAEGRARTALQLDPSQSSTNLLLAIALYNQGKNKEALIAVTDSLWLKPENRVANFYQALILGRLGQYDAALPILERLLATSKDPGEMARISAEIEAAHRVLSELETTAR
jgi:tetratricopeptide (TPR) repeat protein